MDTHTPVRSTGSDRPGATAVAPAEPEPVEVREDAPEVVKKLARRRRDFRRRGPLYRGLFVFAGFVLVLAGLVMLVLPGPAFVVIPIGLAILSLQFTWAGKLLDRALEQGQKAKAKAANTTPRQKLLTGVAMALAAAAFVALAILYDIPVLPV